VRWMVLKSCGIFLSVNVNHCDQLIVVKRMCCVQFKAMLDAASVKEPHTVQGCVGADVGEPHTTTDQGQDRAGGQSCGHANVAADVEELSSGQSHGHVGANVKKKLSSGQSRGHIAVDADVEKLRTGCDVSIQC